MPGLSLSLELWGPVRGAGPASRAVRTTAGGWEPAHEDDRGIRVLGPVSTAGPTACSLPAFPLSALGDNSGRDGKNKCNLCIC